MADPGTTQRSKLDSLAVVSVFRSLKRVSKGQIAHAFWDEARWTCHFLHPRRKNYQESESDARGGSFEALSKAYCRMVGGIGLERARCRSWQILLQKSGVFSRGVSAAVS
jgi:hypothetical protein